MRERDAIGDKARGDGAANFEKTATVMGVGWLHGGFPRRQDDPKTRGHITTLRWHACDLCNGKR